MAEQTSAFVFNPDQKKTLLSIDGGGMRGVIPLAMLMYLEDKTGKPAYDLFDMVGGTSTGAIIGAGLGLGMTAHEIMDVVYKTGLPKAFAKQRFFWLRYVMRRTRYLYPFDPFLSVLGQYAQGKKISDIERPILLMTTKDIRTSNTYYITNHGPGAEKFKDWPLSGAVGASGASPIFFPPILGNLVDGGVGSFGNPCLATSIEAVEYIKMRSQNILHVSLGTGFVANEHADGAGAKFSLRQWLDYIFLEDIDDAALQQVYTTRAIYRAMDFRRYNPYLDQGSVENILKVDTGGLKVRSLSLDSVQLDQIELMQRIGYAYAEAIDWSLEKQMPWHTTGGHQQPTFRDVNWLGTAFDTSH